MHVAALLNLPMTETKSLHTTNLKFRMIQLPNNAPISCVVETAKEQLSNFFPLFDKPGYYLLEQNADGMFVCVQTIENKKREVKKIAICIDFDGLQALFSVKGEEKKELFQAFAARLGLTNTDNLEEMRALALSRLNVKHSYADATLELLMTPSESYIKNIIEVDVEKPVKARHTFMVLSDNMIRGNDRYRTVYEAMYPILVCVDSTLSKHQLDNMFLENSESEQCYLRFSAPGSNQITFVTRRVKIALSFSVGTSSTGNRWLNWVGNNNYLTNIPQIIFGNREYGYKSTKPSLFGT